MTTGLRDFLRERAAKYQAEASAGKAAVDEWRAAIEQLFTQLRQWLKDADPENVIEIKEGREEITERGLGRYTVPRLDLRVLGKWIGIIPKARNTVGTATPPQKSAPAQAAGRVDITDEVRRYVLYRFQEGGRDEWLIDDRELDEARPGVVQFIPRFEPKRFDQSAFERVLMSYLR